MLATSLLHVSGCVVPSSKNERGIVAAVGKLGVLKGMLKEAPAAPGVAPDVVPGKVSARPFLVTGDWPLIESIDTDGERPVSANDRRVRA